jgi:CubicO group peptidase (beta-lactamase class C family)
MRKLLLTLVFALCSHLAFAQSSKAQNDSVFTLVAKYINDKNSDAIYALAGNDFRAHLTKETFTSFAQNTLFPMGKIRQSDFLKFRDGKSSYKLTFEQGILEMIFSLDKNGQLGVFAFKPYKEPVADKTTLVLTSNLMKSGIDSLVDGAARPYIQKVNTVGLCIGVLKNGKMTTFGYGETARANGKLPGENTLFEIGSISKTFTATLLAWYVQEKKVKLTDPITKYLPDSVTGNKELQKITLLMLSNHTSGLPSLPDNFEEHMTDALNPYKDYSRPFLFSYLKTCKPDTIPGSTYSYSNLAAGLLGVILERVSGKTYEQMVERIICKPLQMGSTVQHMNDEQRSHFVSVYNEKGAPTPAWDLDALAPAGALRSTVHDLLLYAKANLGKTKGKLDEAMSLTHKITNTRKMEVGLGWHGATIKGQHVIWHNGGTYGSSSYLGFIPGKDIAVVVLSNCSEHVDEVAKKILAGMIGKQ